MVNSSRVKSLQRYRFRFFVMGVRSEITKIWRKAGEIQRRTRSREIQL